jgi:hypothetical protein
VSAPAEIVVCERQRRLAFGYAAMLDYHGGGSPAGVAHAFKVMELAFGLLAPADPPQRREVEITTAFRGPGARDAFELVTRALSDGRLRYDDALARPERGLALERFTFRVGYRGRSVELRAREGFVPEEMIELARIEPRDATQEARLAQLKAHAAELVMGSAAASVYELV